MALAVAHHSPGFPERAGSASWTRWLWPVVVLAVVGLAAALAIFGHAQPAYDANGWLTWGRQVLHGNFNLYGAPSWKPLTFVFTFPYALVGHQGELWLWILTACSAGIAAPLLAGRLAWRLAPRGDGWMPSWLPPALAAIVACLITATMTVAAKSTPISAGYLRQILTVLSDPLDTALCLAAVDRLLSRRYGWALFLVWFAALGRPEVWPFLLILCVWLWVKVPSLRLWAVLSIVIMPVAWYLAPAVASHSWNSASQFDQNLATAIQGNKVTGVLDRVRTLSGRAIQVEVALAILAAVLRRDRRTLAIVGLALLWTVVEIVFALKGLSAVQRYLMEAGALLAVVGGVGVAHALTWPAWRGLPLRLGGILAVIAFAVATVPFIHATVNGARGIVQFLHTNDESAAGLTRLIAKAGGAKRLLACGYPDVTLGWQSALAWHIGVNVGDIGFRTQQEIQQSKQSAVVYNRVGPTGWKLALVNLPAGNPSCTGLQGLSS